MSGYNNQLTGYAQHSKTANYWREYIAKGRSKIERKIENNTYVRTIENGVAIKLHTTDVVTILENGHQILNSGGWLSVTTKDRINSYSNAGISQRKGVWYMGDGSLFYDGMTIDSDGKPTKPKQPTDYETKLKAIKKQAKQYAHDFVEALKSGTIDYPSGGDCWACSMRDTNGHTVMGTDHLKQHIEDKYYVPSLLVNAGRDAGYQDFQIGLMGIGGRKLFIDPERNIYKYVVKQLQKELA